ncbi:MAG: ABC transporter permease [Fibrobacteres bacterium]|nr:ABC transporter permease [Fibrobacterota bacterium]
MGPVPRPDRGIRRPQPPFPGGRAGQGGRQKRMKSILIIAVNAFRETVRDKILYNLVLFTLGLILFSLLLGEWSVFARVNVIKDFTLAVMSIAGLLMSIFVGIGLIQKEIQRKTILTLLAKPLPRWHFIVGKYLGLLMVLALNLAIMTLVFFILLRCINVRPTPSLLTAIYLTFMEMAVVTSAALLFSAFSTPTLSALFTLGVYVAGHLSGDILNHLEFIRKYGQRLPGTPVITPFTGKLIHAVYFMIPNLENFNIRGRVVYELPIPPHYVLYTSLYGMAFIGVYLLIASLWFGKRDFI